MEIAPILFLIFNRPEKTQKVFEQIKRAKPSRLYIAADGPRNAEEKSICDQTRAVVLEGIDWPCQTFTLFRENNLGCTPAVVSAISWFFENETEGIILEDDCYPDISFFGYCTELLGKYAHEPSVMHISGSNFMFDKKVTEDSYFFTKISICWGWATWKRAWEKYRLNRVEEVPEQEYIRTLRNPGFEDFYFEKWKQAFDYHRNGSDTIWDYRWLFTLWYFRGIAISPAVNLVKNIGYGLDATTSKGHNKTRNLLANLQTNTLTVQHHPANIQPNPAAEQQLNHVFFPKPTIFQVIFRKISFFVPTFIKNMLRKLL
ncbi:MAG: nucleotide-diphospho-sugar transferase [Cytophagales bacterium]|nr:nucleotide-diphospho-sugar transferase [Cytophagales bacterium]